MVSKKLFEEVGKAAHTKIQIKEIIILKLSAPISPNPRQSFICGKWDLRFEPYPKINFISQETVPQIS